ncbi:MAG: autotransporter outer membrane beta-barrel domain-containing protein [Desulfovibrionaceae bacterium]|nr:autotransporter outer membrane beta-barrel domain-containing protein [Desulfovibrionaceae bacterium]
MKHACKGLFLMVPLLLAFTVSAHAAGNVTTSIESVTKQTAVVSVQNTVTSITARSSMVMGFSGGGGFHNPGSTPRGGVNSGNNGDGIGVWVMGNAYWLDKSGSDNYSGDLYMLTGGFDKRFDDLLLGISFGGEWLDLGLERDGKYKSTGFTIAPYVSYLLRDDVMLDFSVGYSSLSNDVRGWNDNTGAMSEGDYNSWRLYGATGATKTWEYDAWRFSSRLGALYLHQSTRGFDLRSPGGLVPTPIEGSDYNLFQMQLGGRAGYDFGDFIPFVGVTYFQDIAKTGGSDDMVGADFDLGLNWNNGPSTIGVIGTYGVREDFQKIGGMLSFRYEF